MPRRSRALLPGVPLHIIQRGNNRQACFAADDDYRAYLEWLGERAAKMASQIRAYVLMTNHYQPCSPVGLESAQRRPGLLMKGLGQGFVQYFNR